MPDFTPPTLPDELLARRLTVVVRSTFDLSDAETSALQGRLGDSFVSHTTFRQALSYKDGSAELRGVIGIHERKERQEELFSTTPSARHWVHFSLSFTEGVKGTTHIEGTWDRTAHALAEVVSPKAAEVEAFWSLPKQTAAFKVALPIPLLGDIPGFSEIQGVRLVQLDPDRNGLELYSLILNHHRDQATFQVVTALDSHSGADVLTRALDVSLSIATLAFDRVEPHA